MANVLKVLNQYGIKSIEEADEICEAKGTYGRFKDAVKYIDPRKE